MLRSDLDAILTEALSGRRLLTHPFYRRWEAGELSRAELAAYAGQYRHFEAALPDILRDIASGLDSPEAAGLVEANLADELGVPEPHLLLFDSFIEAVGGRCDEPSPATFTLVQGYRDLARSDVSAALGALAAYEVQSAEIAASKASGLKEHYRLDETQTRFWDVHGDLEEAHASWTLDALASSGAQPATLRSAAGWAADAWWSFLDERQAAALVA